MPLSNRITIWLSYGICLVPNGGTETGISLNKEFASLCGEFNRYRQRAVIMLVLYAELI